MRVRRLGLAIGTLAALALPRGGGAVDLYQWTDEHGVIRYTPDASRVPGSRRHTLLRVEPGSAPPVPEGGPSLAPRSGIHAPPGDPGLESDPFNAPEQARRVESSTVPESLELPGAASAPAAGTRTRPAPAREASPGDAQRRAELVAAIERDEEALKALISAAGSDEPGTLEQSQELREIARRLPELQAQLRALDEGRERQP
jgi:hypothetical protein